MWNDANRGDANFQVEPGETGAMVNGSFVELSPGEPFGPTMMALARNAGLGKFRVFIGNDEIEENNSPDFIEEGMAVKVVPYDEAG